MIFSHKLEAKSEKKDKIVFSSVKVLNLIMSVKFLSVFKYESIGFGNHVKNIQKMCMIFKLDSYFPSQKPTIFSESLSSLCRIFCP